MDYSQESLILHKKLQWKLETVSKIHLKDTVDLSLAYSPWVAEPCRQIYKNRQTVYDYTIKSNTIAVISDGTAVLGLWDIWPEAALPVMEGKCVLFKQFAWVNAFPIVLATKDTEEIIQTIKNIASWFGWINLEDISAPRCFEIERRLNEELDIPVFHDDQHGTAIVTLAWLINSLKIVWKNKEDVKIVINGVGAAWVAIAQLFLKYGVKDIIMVDSVGTIYKWRNDLNSAKLLLAESTNTACLLNPDSHECVKWWLQEAVVWRDVFVGVSKAWILTPEMIKTMNSEPIVFAMANPVPEIMPELAKASWVKIIATGRSDYPNQLNNVLVFPGIFKGALEKRINIITDDMKIRAAENIASLVDNLNVDNIIPSPFNLWLSEAVSKAIQ